MQMKPEPLLTGCQEILSRVKKWKKHDWHFHLFTPSCLFNSYRKHAILVESVHGNFAAIFNYEPINESKQLAELMYSKGFLEKNQRKYPENASFEKLFRRVREMASMGMEWHPRHWHPSCIFNRRKGKHSIAVEDRISGKVMEAFYGKLPANDIARLERIFYRKRPIQQL